MARESEVSNPATRGEPNKDESGYKSILRKTNFCSSPSFTYVQKIAAEFIATFLLVFMGCGSGMVDKKSKGSISHLGVSLVWGMAVTILIYTVGHISGAHMNSAVTLASAIVGRFPFKEVPGYMAAQISGSITAGFVLRGLFGNIAHVAATVPTGPVMQSFAMELVITFCLMFVVSAVCSDGNAVKHMGGVAVGATIAATITIAGPISGGSLNPSRSLGSAVSGNKYTSIWVYLVAPTLGAIIGAYSYELVRARDVGKRSAQVPQRSNDDNLHADMHC